MSYLHTIGLTRTLQRSVILVLSLACYACGGSMGELEDYVESVKANPPGEIEPIPPVKNYPEFTYPGHESDPFNPDKFGVAIAIPQDPTNPAKPRQPTVTIDENRVKEYLESYPLDSLGMVGTLDQNNRMYALIQTPDGTIQRVSVGNHMGQNHGKINKITESEITLTEKIPDRLGGHIERPASIALPEQ